MRNADYYREANRASSQWYKPGPGVDFGYRVIAVTRDELEAVGLTPEDVPNLIVSEKKETENE